MLTMKIFMRVERERGVERERERGAIELAEMKLEDNWFLACNLAPSCWFGHVPYGCMWLRAFSGSRKLRQPLQQERAVAF